MWHTVEITRLRSLTDQAVEMRVADMPSARPGQFCVVEVAERRSSFSIVASDADGWVLGVKATGGGGVSDWMARGGGEARVAGPYGDFGVVEGVAEHVLVAGGSGITPIYAVVRALVARGVRPVLYFGNDRPEDAMYGPELRALAAAGQLELHEVVGRAWPALQVPPEAALYMCGPAGMMDALAATVKGHAAERTRLEHYTAARGEGVAAEVRWKPRWGRAKESRVAAGQTLLGSAEAAGWTWDHACGVGACGTCRMRLEDGAVDCGGRRIEAGAEVLTCVARPVTDRIAVRPAKGWRRPEAVAAALVLAVLTMGIWAVPPGMGFRAMGPLNTGHETLGCGDCHKPAAGSVRQQLSHNARAIVGFHDEPWVDVGYAPVDNAACLACHDRPNDRHPTSRFEELRFAEQRAVLGPHQCNNCHGEHHGERIAAVGNGFCVNCHEGMEVEDDPIDVPHADLALQGDWNTCLTCHDFHGNHERTAPTRMADRLSEEAVRAYFAGGPDPYGSAKRYLPE